MRGRPTCHRRLFTVPAAGLLYLALVAPDAAGSGDLPRSALSVDGITWTADLSRVDADDVNVRHVDGALRLREPDFRPASVPTGQGYGTQVLSAVRLGRVVERVGAELTADVPAGARAIVEVRGRDARGRWTEWRQAAGGVPAELPRPAATVQARLTLWDGSGGLRVRNLTLSGAAASAQGIEATTASPPGALTARVFATRVGLVGRTTANGHVVQADDHFVALPSRRGLSPRGSGEYSVRVCGPARCETAPVWDVGPWNIRDDHWNPSSVRETFQDLPQGLPEAQAAHLGGYNGGLDGFGRRVTNPAGIDLADGTFANIGLKDNGWVAVTYLWTGGGSGQSSPTWSTGASRNVTAIGSRTRESANNTDPQGF